MAMRFEKFNVFGSQFFRCHKNKVAIFLKINKEQRAFFKPLLVLKKAFLKPV